MKHPAEERLALYAGGDANWLDRRTIALHLRSCDVCRNEVARFANASSVLVDQALGMPAGVNWNVLSAEINANIKLGIAAGACIERVEEPAQRRQWLLPLAYGVSACAMVAVSWWLNFPHQKAAQPIAEHAFVQQPVVMPAPEGIQVKTRTGELTLMRPRQASQAIYVSSPGSLRERFVNDETGQVTINNVYSE